MTKSSDNMNSDLIMPWGQHKGTRIGDLKMSYLKWLAENCEDEDIQLAADAEYIWRKDHNENYNEED